MRTGSRTRIKYRKVSIRKQNIFTNLIILPFLILTLAISGCKDDNVDDEDSGDPPGGGGGSGSATGGSVLFDGTGEHLETTRAWYTDDFTICLWMQPSAITGNTLLSMSDNDKYFFLAFNGTTMSWYFESNNDAECTVDAAQTFTVGTKYHVCVTGDHGTASTAINARAAVFVNGVQRGSCNATAYDGVASTLSSTLTIGYEPAPVFQAGVNSKSDPYAGVLDNLIIWSHELTAAAINQIYTSGNAFDPNFSFSNYSTTHVSNLKVWYQMGELPGDALYGSGVLIHDETGNEDATPVDFETNDFGLSL